MILIYKMTRKKSQTRHLDLPLPINLKTRQCTQNYDIGTELIRRKSLISDHFPCNNHPFLIFCNDVKSTFAFIYTIRHCTAIEKIHTCILLI